MKHANSNLNVLLVSVLVAASSLPAVARDDDEFRMSAGSHFNGGGTIRSDQLLELGTPTADGLKLQADSATRAGNFDRAIMYLQRAVELSPSDTDARSDYADALEKKLRKQKVRNPKLYNFVLKQWLLIAKQSEFDDEKQKACTHLMGLCGRVPQQYETQKHFLKTVIVIEDDPSKKVSLASENTY